VKPRWSAPPLRCAQLFVEYRTVSYLRPTGRMSAEAEYRLGPLSPRRARTSCVSGGAEASYQPVRRTESRSASAPVHAAPKIRGVWCEQRDIPGSTWEREPSWSCDLDHPTDADRFGATASLHLRCLILRKTHWRIPAGPGGDHRNFWPRREVLVQPHATVWVSGHLARLMSAERTCSQPRLTALESCRTEICRYLMTLSCAEGC